MIQRPIPSDPDRRKVIVVLNEHNMRRCAYERDGVKHLLNDHTHVLQVPLPEAGDALLAKTNILDGRLATPGCILIQSPFDTNRYEDASSAPQNFAYEKHMHFSLLCKHLGAKEILVKQIDVVTREGVRTIGLTVERAGLLRLEGKTKKADEESFLRRFELRDTFVGAPPALAAADDLLRKTGLCKDADMLALVEMRRSETNPLLSRSLKINLSSESQSNISLAGKLTLPGWMKMHPEYGENLKETKEYVLEIMVRF
jgi:hypothetical protein